MSSSVKIPPHYSPVIRSGDLLFTSGQLPLLNRETKAVPEGIAAQTLLVLQKVEALLKERGLTKRHIIKTSAFISDIEDWGTVNEVYASFFDEGYKPARSILPIKDLHFGCLIELEAIASFTTPSDQV